MKRHLLIIAICLLLGAVVNVAVAWGCAAWIRAEYGEHQFAILSDGRLWMVLKFDEPGASRFVSVKGLDGWDRSLEIDDAMTLPSWSRLVRKQSSGAATTLEDARGWPSLAMSCEFKRAGVMPVPSATTNISSAATFSVQWKTTLLNGGIRLRPRANPAWGAHKCRALPLRPVWPGFAINTLFFATILWLLVPGPFVLRRFLRVRRGLCPKCAYPMAESSVCTECGCGLPKRASAT